MFHSHLVCTPTSSTHAWVLSGLRRNWNIQQEDAKTRPYSYPQRCPWQFCCSWRTGKWQILAHMDTHTHTALGYYIVIYLLHPNFFHGQSHLRGAEYIFVLCCYKCILSAWRRYPVNTWLQWMVLTCQQPTENPVKECIDKRTPFPSVRGRPRTQTVLAPKHPLD